MADKFDQYMAEMTQAHVNALKAKPLTAEDVVAIVQAELRRCNPSSLSEKKWLTLAEAARRMGYAYSTLKKWHSDGKLPFPVYGTSDDLRVKAEETDAWLERTKRGPNFRLGRN